MRVRIFTGRTHQIRVHAAHLEFPVAGDGKVYIVSQTGVVVVLDALHDDAILSTGEMDDEVYATPAIADGHVYIRTRGALYAFRAAGAAGLRTAR